MGLFDKLFGGGKKKRNPLDDKPPIYGGDGSSVDQAVVINCASMGMANRLIDNWIAERHGQEGTDWTRGVEMFLDSAESDPPTLRSIGVQTQNGQSANYVFNVGRPMRASMKLYGMMSQGKKP